MLEPCFLQPCFHFAGYLSRMRGGCYSFIIASICYQRNSTMNNTKYCQVYYYYHYYCYYYYYYLLIRWNQTCTDEHMRRRAGAPGRIPVYFGCGASVPAYCRTSSRGTSQLPYSALSAYSVKQLFPFRACKASQKQPPIYFRGGQIMASMHALSRCVWFSANLSQYGTSTVDLRESQTRLHQYIYCYDYQLIITIIYKHYYYYLHRYY